MVYEGVQIAAALATSRTAAQMTSRFRIMLKRTSISDREDGCPKLLPSQLSHSKLSDTLIQEATSEIMRRDTHSLEVVSQLRSDLQHSTN